MKILLIHTSYRLKGGEDSVVVAEKKLLEDNNHEVFLLSFKNSSNSFQALASFLISIFNPFSYLKTIKAIKKIRPDVIHIHNWHFGASPAVFIAAYKKKIPIVHTLHNYRLLCPSGTLFHNKNIFLDSLHQGFAWSAIKNRVYRDSFFQTLWLAVILWFHKKIGTWNKVDKYILLTPFSQNLFMNSSLKISPDKFIAKPNFVEKNSTVSDLDRTDTFLFIGRLSEEKGILCLLNAFEKSHFKLKIGGEGPLTNTVKEACKKHPNILYLGILDKKQVQEQMKECTALIFPSIWNEPFGLVLIEAFLLKMPIIASNLGAIPFILKDGYNGLLFEAGNFVDLQNKLTEWGNKSIEEKILFSKNAYQSYLENYTPDKNLDQLLSIYDSVLR